MKDQARMLEGTRRVRVIFEDYIIEYPLSVVEIQKARFAGLPVRHPVDRKVSWARYSMTMVYWIKKSFVYVFFADD